MIKLLSGVSRRGGIGSKRCVELIISEKRERYNAKIKGKMRKRDENKAQFGEKRRQFWETTLCQLLANGIFKWFT